MTHAQVVGAELDAHGIWRSSFEPIEHSGDLVELDLDLYPDRLEADVDFHGDGQARVLVHRVADRPGFGWVLASQIPGNPYGL